MSITSDQYAIENSLQSDKIIIYLKTNNTYMFQMDKMVLTVVLKSHLNVLNLLIVIDI